MSQFQVLYRVFLMRVVDLELLSASDDDTAKLLGQLAAALMGISIMYTAPLIFVGGRLDRTLLLTMQHLLIATTMTVVGVFAVLSWDSTFPDRRDVLVLAPLPVRTSTLFGAKLSASAAALGMAVLSLNVFSGLVWPFLFASRLAPLEVMRSFAAYWFVVAAAGLFLFCAVLGLQWLAGQVLPRQLFLRMSSVLQLSVLCLIVSMFFLEPSLESRQALTAPENQWLLRCLPSYWFLGLLQQLNGQMDPAFRMLMHRAWWGLGVSVLGAGSAVLLSYLRTLQKMIEEPDIMPGAIRGGWTIRAGGGLQTAITTFSARTVLRSRQHRLLLTFYLGIGFGMVMAFVKTPGRLGHKGGIDVPMLAASILMLSFALLGMRVVFAMPILLKANWVFRITESGAAESYSGVVRWVLYTLAFAPMMALLVVWFMTVGPLRLAAGHIVVLLFVGATVCELCLYEFEKIPFTCSYLPGKSNVPVTFWCGVVLVIPLVSWMAETERRALDHAGRYIELLAWLIGALLLAGWRTWAALDGQRGLKFEEEPDPVLLGLGLQGQNVVALRYEPAEDREED